MSGTANGRPQWDNKAQFLLTCIGFAVGLGNIWRFPYTLQNNGGGAFLIPYFIMLFVEGIPLLYVELAVGQLLGAGSVVVWEKISPYVAGIGLCSMVVSFLVGIYYNTIMAWCFWYLFNSFSNPLPWKDCPAGNSTIIVPECAASSPSQYFWYRETLNISPGIEISGGIKEALLGCLMLAWVIVLLCLSRGIASSGKVVYFTATFPFLVLIIFLGQGLSLEGSSLGINYLFSADFHKLNDASIWLAAATQVFFSLGVGFGGMIAFASFNPKNNNCERDSVLIALINSFTSILASLVIFSVLGFKATLEYNKCIEGNIHQLLVKSDVNANITTENYQDFVKNNSMPDLNLTKCDVEDFLEKSASGPGLAFMVIADAIVSMPGSQFWSILFFLMLLTLGIDSMFGTMEGLTTPLHDLIASPKVKQTHVTSGVVAVSFLISITFVQGSGSYWLDVFNDYAGGLPLLIIAFFELAAVGWMYRYPRFASEVDEMLGERTDWFTKALKYYWWGMIPFIGPSALLVVFIGYLYENFSSVNVYDAWSKEKGATVETHYPPVAVAVSAIVAILCTIWIPIVASVRGIKYARTHLTFFSVFGNTEATGIDNEAMETNIAEDDSAESKKAGAQSAELSGVKRVDETRI